MPAHYVVDVQNRLVRTTFEGPITYQDVADFSSRLAADPAFAPDFSELSTFEEGSDLQLQLSDFRQLSRVDPFSAHARRAYVVRSRGALYGVTRIYQTFRDTPNVRIFDTLDEAMAWLNVRERRVG